jgi:hypothetical protein
MLADSKISVAIVTYSSNVSSSVKLSVLKCEESEIMLTKMFREIKNFCIEKLNLMRLQ